MARQRDGESCNGKSLFMLTGGAGSLPKAFLRQIDKYIHEVVIKLIEESP